MLICSNQKNSGNFLQNKKPLRYFSFTNGHLENNHWTRLEIDGLVVSNQPICFLKVSSQYIFRSTTLVSETLLGIFMFVRA